MTDDTPKVQPAMTPDEWQKLQAGGFPAYGGGPTVYLFEIRKDGQLWMPDATDEFPLDSEQRHALAALCLYQQPFGFSQEDVADVRAAADFFVDQLRLYKPGRMDSDEGRMVVRLRSLADRISALLPPAP